MILKFMCSKCNETIITKFSKIGDNIQCPHCENDVIVPTEAIEIINFNEDEYSFDPTKNKKFDEQGKDEQKNENAETGKSENVKSLKEEEKSNSKGWIGCLAIIIVVVIIIIANSGAGDAHTCQWCGKTYHGRGYTTLMRVVNQVDDEDSPLNSYCSRKCAMEWLRNH